MNLPKVSIAIATYNSGSTLEKTLNSIKRQKYPQTKIEILIIDGGSTDNTIKISEKYDCTILPNIKTELIYAKYIGFLKAKGRYLMFLDSDEILENENSLWLKYQAIKSITKVGAVIPSGYKSPPRLSSINDYINEFGDPFTFFVYRESKGNKFLINDWINKYKIVQEDNKHVVFDFSNQKYLPLIELWAGGCFLDLKYIRLNIPKGVIDLTTIPHLFYILNENKRLVAVTKNDNTIHYSCETIPKYLKKISSRIKNNVFETDMGKGGYIGREKFQSNWRYFKKFLFIPYSFSVIIPIIDSLYLSISRGKGVYFIHPFLCLYTSLLIIYYYFLKYMKFDPAIRSYGQ